MKILIIGPAHPLRGGIANFTERLASAFQEEGDHVQLLSFSLQYPSFLFPGKTQYTSAPKPDLPIHTRINAINPFNWIRNGWNIRKQKYDLIVVMYWQPFMAPCLGTIGRIAGKNAFRIALLHNMIPHEPHFFDRMFSRYFVKSMDGFLALSKAVLEDLGKFDNEKPRDWNPHPIYDVFGNKWEKTDARRKLGLDPGRPVILFFGFIRKYKGLDLLLMALDDEGIRRKNIQVVVAGEFYDDPGEYMQIIKSHKLENVIFKSEFIADEHVPLYFSACDIVVQPYRTATQSGVTQIAYHFEKPMLVTDVGGLSEIVPHNKAGYVLQPNPSEITAAINDFYEQHREPEMIEHVRHEKDKYSWDKLVGKIKKLIS
ncbi:MAG: glycosyltransferase [Bacteroidales bacterium]